LTYRKGESDLSSRKGEFYLSATCDALHAKQIDAQNVIDFDLGIKNLAMAPMVRSTPLAW
jgi:hypothetical protein